MGYEDGLPAIPHGPGPADSSAARSAHSKGLHISITAETEPKTWVRISSERSHIVLLGIALLLLAGCASKPTGKPQDTSKEPPVDLPPQVNASGVTTNVYGPLPKRELYYTVKTDLVTANLGTNMLESGVTGKVSGTIYTHGSAQFSADSAKADKSSPKIKDLDVLTLVGHVKIHSLKPAGDLFCDRLSVNFKTHILKAVGNVRFHTSSGLVGTLPEAWATQDLTKIATPSLFDEM